MTADCDIGFALNAVAYFLIFMGVAGMGYTMMHYYRSKRITKTKTESIALEDIKTLERRG